VFAYTLKLYPTDEPDPFKHIRNTGEQVNIFSNNYTENQPNIFYDCPEHHFVNLNLTHRRCIRNQYVFRDNIVTQQCNVINHATSFDLLQVIIRPYLFKNYQWNFTL